MVAEFQPLIMMANKLVEKELDINNQLSISEVRGMSASGAKEYRRTVTASGFSQKPEKVLFVESVADHTAKAIEMTPIGERFAAVELIVTHNPVCFVDEYTMILLTVPVDLDPAIAINSRLMAEQNPAPTVYKETAERDL